MAKNQMDNYNPPYYYDPGNFNEFASKSSGFSSAFKSKVNRMKFEQNLMEPAKYNVQSPERRSKNINFHKKWI